MSELGSWLMVTVVQLFMQANGYVGLKLIYE